MPRRWPTKLLPPLALLIAASTAGDGIGAERSVMSGRWVEIGPAPLLGGQVGLHGHERPVTGRISAIAIDPKDDRHWLAGGALGGVWETENGGNSWRPLTDGEASLAMGALAFAAGRQGVAYAGTGEALPVPAGFPGRGLLRLTKSNDTGAWRVVPVRRPDSSVPFVGLGFSDIKVNPKNDEHLVVATRWRPQPDFLGGREPSYQEDERGIIELTPTSWAQHVPGDATSLVVHPGRFECMYAGVTRSQNLSDAPTVGLFRRADAKCASSGRPPRTEYRRRTKCTADPTGARWTRISGPWDDEACDRAQMLGNPAAWPAFLARVELAIARNPDVVYVSVATRHVVGAEQAREEARGGGRLLGVWRTDNAWDANPDWVRLPVEATDGGSGQFGFCGAHPATNQADALCHWSHVLSVDPRNENVLYAGGIALWKATIHCLRKSAEGVLEPACITWTDVSHIAPPPPPRPRLRRRGIHVDQHAMGWTAAGHRLVVGNDGGVWSTTDSGRAWKAHNNGLSVIQFYRGAVADTDGGSGTIILGGTQDNGTAVWTGASWQWIVGGDGGPTIIDPSNPSRHWAIASKSVLFGNRLRRSRDGGKEFTFADGGLPVPDSVERMPLAACEDAGKVTVIAGGAPGLWKSPAFFTHRASPTWVLNFAPKGESVSAAAFAPSVKDCSAYAVGTTGGRVYVTTNGGRGWCQLQGLPRIPQLQPPPPFPPPPRPITEVQFNATNADLVYASMWETDENRATDTQFGRVYQSAHASCPVVASGTDHLHDARWVSISLPADVPAAEGGRRAADGRENIRTLAAHPVHASALLVGTDTGVWASIGTDAEGGRRWTRHNHGDHGMPNVPVFDIKISRKGQVVAFTYGRGAFVWEEACDGRPSAVVGTNFLPCSRGVRSGRNVSLERGGREIPSDQRLASP